MENKKLKKRLINSKCMADMFVWLGFEYKKVDEGYLFERTDKFDRAWKDVHSLKQYYKD